MHRHIVPALALAPILALLPPAIARAQGSAGANLSDSASAAAPARVPAAVSDLATSAPVPVLPLVTVLTEIPPAVARAQGSAGANLADSASAAAPARTPTAVSAAAPTSAAVPALALVTVLTVMPLAVVRAQGAAAANLSDPARARVTGLASPRAPAPASVTALALVRAPALIPAPPLSLASIAPSDSRQPAQALRQAAATPRPGPRRSVEVIAGYAGFLDESLVDHAIVGGTFYYRLGRRVSIGPEVVFMAGPGTDRDLFVTGNALFDFLMPTDGPRPGTINPFVVAGGGVMVHRSRFGTAGFSVTEGALTGGAGARIWVTERVYAQGAYRVGWEPHIRLDGGLGVAW